MLQVLCPQAIKRRQGMPPTKGGNASNKELGPQRASPLQRQRREHSLRNSKKRRGPTPSQFDASPPHQKGATTRCRKKYLLVVAITTKRLLESANQEQGGFLIPPVRRIAPSPGGAHLYVHNPTNPAAISSTLRNEKSLGSLVPGAPVSITRPAHAPPRNAI